MFFKYISKYESVEYLFEKNFITKLKIVYLTDQLFIPTSKFAATFVKESLRSKQLEKIKLAEIQFVSFNYTCSIQVRKGGGGRNS